MILENIGASLLGSLLAFTSSAGITADSLQKAIPRAEAQVAQMRDVQFNWNGWNDWRNKPVIDEINPEEGPVGTTVTLEGERFDDDNIVRFGSGAIHDVTVSDDGTELTFTVPEDMGRYCPPWRFCTAIAYEVTPDVYTVRVQDGNRTSNAVSFEVTGNDNNPDEPLSIDAIAGPAALDAGEEGTWRVDVTTETDGNLRYAVKWGDEGWSPLRLMNTDEEIQSSALFTHTYAEEGTYHPEFTVIDEDGNKVSTSTTVVVGEESNQSVPYIALLSPATAQTGDTVTVTGTGFDDTSSVTVGGVSASDVEVTDDTRLSFTVPALSVGTHTVTVQDDDGTSNERDLKVVADSQVSIRGVDAPTRLEVGEEGTWTVDAATNAEGNLKYSVDWGEGFMARLMSGTVTQSSATFTHTYNSAGTYYPKFTVTDENGNSSSVSASVVVRDN